MGPCRPFAPDNIILFLCPHQHCRRFARFKAKIAHTHSYPTGAAAISKALAGVPQFEWLELTFSTTWASQLAATKYAVIHVKYKKRCSFFSASHDMIARGDLEATWSILVCPVPRNQRHAVQISLLEGGLQFVRTWLEENTSQIPGKNTLSLSYEKTGMLSHDVTKKLQPERI